MKGEEAQDLCRVARFLFEAMMLKRTLRTGYAFLGQGKESVAAHTYGMLVTAYMLYRLHKGPVDLERLLLLALFHDLPEARTGDANRLHKRYVQVDEEKAAAEQLEGLPGREELKALYKEWREGKTMEARLAKDADQLDMLISLKEQLDLGSRDAALWIPHVRARLRTEAAKRLAEAVLSEHWASWWMKHVIGDEENEGDP